MNETPSNAPTYDDKDLSQQVTRYFQLIRDLRAGDEKSVPSLMEMWDVDGVFEFVGAPPVVATFKGAVAIQTLYQNRIRTSGMPLRLEGRDGLEVETALSIVDTEVTHVRANGKRAVAGWRTTIGTKAGAGFDVAGSHQFVFENGRIKSLRVSISPKADQSVSETARLDVANLTVVDVGRLSLAAWPVV